jgi:hypothetical protein
MRAPGEDDMFKLRCLSSERLVERGMGVAVNVHPPGRDAVQELTAIGGVEVDTLPTDDGKRFRRSFNLSIRMPDAGAIAFNQTGHVWKIEDGERKWKSDLCKTRGWRKLKDSLR